MSMALKLADRAQAGKPIRVGLIGGQVRHDVPVAGAANTKAAGRRVADLDLDRVRRAFAMIGAAPPATASPIDLAAARSGAAPLIANARRARSRSRSATPTTCSPGVRCACDRNIVPNLPAPIKPTRIGFSACARPASFNAMLTGVSYQTSEV